MVHPVISLPLRCAEYSTDWTQGKVWHGFGLKIAQVLQHLREPLISVHVFPHTGYMSPEYLFYFS